MEVTASPGQLENLGVIDRAAILHNLLLKARDNMEGRYSPILDNDNASTIMEHFLNPIVRELCENGEFTLKE